MKIAITDANIFIDLLYINLHIHIGQLGFEIYTTRQVLEELDDEQKDSFTDILLYHFNEQEIQELSNYSIKKGLSDADHSVLFIAERLSATVISGDALLRKTCQERNLKVHGILWIIDECIKNRYITESEAHGKLSSLMDYNKRLPYKDCIERLIKWKPES